jgi:hypothetical protein
LNSLNVALELALRLGHFIHDDDKSLLELVGVRSQLRRHGVGCSLEIRNARSRAVSIVVVVVVVVVIVSIIMRHVDYRRGFVARRCQTRQFRDWFLIDIVLAILPRHIAVLPL